MSIVIGADAAGLRLKEVVKDFLEKENFHVVDVTAEGQDFVDVTLAVAAEVNKEEQNLGIVIDAYGAGPFMVATKIKGMVAAEVSDERSAYMTRGHNNSRMITMGAQLVGDELAKNSIFPCPPWMGEKSKPRTEKPSSTAIAVTDSRTC